MCTSIMVACLPALKPLLRRASQAVTQSADSDLALGDGIDSQRFSRAWDHALSQARMLGQSVNMNRRSYQLPPPMEAAPYSTLSGNDGYALEQNIQKPQGVKTGHGIFRVK